MAWGTPLTAVANSALTAAQWNASVRDNLNETAPAKATTAGTIFVATGVNTIAERFILDDIVETSETTTNTSYISLATNGPVVTITTGVKAMVWINCSMSNSTANQGTWASWECSGATTIAAIDSRALYLQSAAGNDTRAGVCSLNTTTPGSNVFRMLYRVTGNTGTFLRRRMQIMSL
jgi:hypothetical protein